MARRGCSVQERVLSPEIKYLLGADALCAGRAGRRQARRGRRPLACTETPGREAPPLALGCGCTRGPHGEPKGTAVMHDGGESDSLIVPVKQPNNREVWTRMGSYGDSYTGTQVETPRQPRVSLRSPAWGMMKWRRLWREGDWPRGTWAGVTGTGRSAGMPCNRHLTGYDRQRTG